MQSDPSKEQRLNNESILLTHVLFLDVERDKQLLTLSAAGVGLLGTLLAAKGTGSIAEIAICFGGIVCFVLAIGFLLHAFKLSKAFALKSMDFAEDSSEVSQASESLANSQNSGVLCFYIGAFLSAMFALVTASNSFESTQMEKSRKTQAASAEASDQKILVLNETLLQLQGKMTSIEEHLRAKPLTPPAVSNPSVVKEEKAGS